MLSISVVVQSSRTMRTLPVALIGALLLSALATSCVQGSAKDPGGVDHAIFGLREEFGAEHPNPQETVEHTEIGPLREDAEIVQYGKHGRKVLQFHVDYTGDPGANKHPSPPPPAARLP